jgi:hypothetical protein
VSEMSARGAGLLAPRGQAGWRGYRYPDGPMATRTIVTSQPDVACDVCERRLLRGEQPDTFLAAGRRRTVCELCAPRAAHEGWQRESESQSLTLPPMRARRGRSLFDRLRQVGRPAGAQSTAPAGTARAREQAQEPEPYDFLDGYERTGAPAAAVHPEALPAEGAEGAEWGEPSDMGVPNGVSPYAAAPQDPYLQDALHVFNASEFPRRLAGVARSLGAPIVNVRSAEHLNSVVLVVVAWELCWYRYEVDLSEEPVETRLLAQGTELDELAREERVGNAVADDSGLLVLA